MIVRFWSARVAPAREEEYLQEVRERVIPEFEKLAGCLGAFFTRRDREGEVEYRSGAHNVGILASRGEDGWGRSQTGLRATRNRHHSQ